MQQDFASFNLLDGESDEDVADPQHEPAAAPGQEAQAPNPVVPFPFQAIPSDRLGDPTLTFSYPFEKGTNENTLERYRVMSPADIVLDLALPFFNVLRDCSNNNESINISMKDMFCYHSFLVLRVHMRLDTTNMYYRPPSMMFTWAMRSTNYCPKFRTRVSIT